MKINKTISIDNKLDEQLKKIKNGSGLINDLLNDYFFGGGGLEEEQIKTAIQKGQNTINKEVERINELKDKLATIKIKKDEVKEKFNKVPEHIIETFRQFPLMTLEALRSRTDAQGEAWEDIKEAYKEYFSK